MIRCVLGDGSRKTRRTLVMLQMMLVLQACGPAAAQKSSPFGSSSSCSGSKAHEADQECTGGAKLYLLDEGWTSFCLDESCTPPEAWREERRLSLYTQSKGLQGLLKPEPIGGHFQADVQLNLAEDLSIPRGLVFFPATRNAQGLEVPDPRHYVALMMDRNRDGHLRIRARDRQPGSWGLPQDQLLDNTGSLDDWQKSRRYEAVLNGNFIAGQNARNDFQVPFSESDGRLRIFHHQASEFRNQPHPFFHLSYHVVKRLFSGTRPAEGWMSLAPLSSWLGRDQRYFLGILVDTPDDRWREHQFFDIRTEELPTEEPKEESDSFRVIKRPYHWSGFSGDAVQVQFGRHFPAASTYRLVFWSEMNNVPAWHINDQLLVTQSFVELWPKNRQQSPGCFEAMSDDLLWNNDVRVLEDNPARKVIHWRSYLVNPAYQTIAETLGRGYDLDRPLETLARSDEIWTIYPDGTSFRKIRYTPDAAGLGDYSYEIAEVSVIAGSRTRPEDHARDGASLEMWNPMGRDYVQLRPHAGKDLSGQKMERGRAPFDSWPQAVAVARLRDGDRDAPLIYSAFAQAGAAPNVSGSYRLIFDVSWHGYEWEFSHWPVSKEAYEYHDKTFANWEAQVTHSALVSVQVSGGGRSAQPKDFVSVIGLNHDPGAIATRVQDWAYPPSIRDLGGCKEAWHDPTQGLLHLTWSADECRFRLESRFSYRDTVPLALKIRSFPSGKKASLWVNGLYQAESQWNLGYEQDGSAVLYIPARAGGIREITLKVE